MNADDPGVIFAKPQELYHKNLYVYCDNNPVVRRDLQGYFGETLFDIVSLGTSVVEVCVNPGDPWNWAGLIGDAIDLIPFLTGAGEATRAVKTANKVADKTTAVIKIQKAVDFTPESAKVVKKPYAEVIRESNPTPDAPSFPVTYTLKATPTVRIINEVTVSKAALKKKHHCFSEFFFFH